MRSDITWLPAPKPDAEDGLFAALRSAQAAALSYVAACAHELHTDGTNIYHATRQAKACGATHGQIAAAMRGGEGG